MSADVHDQFLLSIVVKEATRMDISTQMSYYIEYLTKTRKMVKMHVGLKEKRFCIQESFNMNI